MKHQFSPVASPFKVWTYVTVKRVTIPGHLLQIWFRHMQLISNREWNTNKVNRPAKRKLDEYYPTYAIDVY